MTEVFIVYHSTGGHTKLQAEAILKGVQSVESVSGRLLTCAEATAQIDSLDNAAAIVFGCPTLMGSMSAEMKAFTEAAVQKWFSNAWRNKIAGAFTNSSSFSGDKLNTLLGLMINAMQHGMIYVGLGMPPGPDGQDAFETLEGPGPNVLNRVGSFSGPMASSFHVNTPDAPGPGGIETARLYGKRIAEITRRFVRGADSPIDDYVTPPRKSHGQNKK